MSHSISVFARGLDVAAIRSLLQQRLGTETSAEKTAYGTIYTADVFSVSLSVIPEHGLVDDYGIEFSKYPIQLDLTFRSGAADLHAMQSFGEAMARLLAAVLEQSGANCMIVGELSRLIERDASKSS